MWHLSMSTSKGYCVHLMSLSALHLSRQFKLLVKERLVELGIYSESEREVAVRQASRVAAIHLCTSADARGT